VLARDGDLTIGRFDCAGADATGAETAGAVELVFVHSGAYRVDSTRGGALADRGRALLLRRGEEYRVRHPLGGRDQSLVLALRDGLFERLCHDLAPGRDPEHVATGLARPLAHPLYWRSRRLRATLERTSSGAEARGEEARALVASTVARFLSSVEPSPTEPSHDPAIEAVQRLLHTAAGRHSTLDELARSVALSPFVLARRFRRRLGESIHQYRLTLVLREALERLAAGERDLTTLALDLGFADHAHFTHAFRRRFGLPPSAARRELGVPRRASE